MNPDTATPLPGSAGPDELLELYDASVRSVYRYLLKATGGDVALAEDLTQETFLAAARAIGTGEHVGEGWLIRVARNKFVDVLRRREREQRKLELLQGGASDDDTGFDPVDRDEACRLLQALPPEQRAAVALRYLDDLPVADVAEALGRTVAATESLLARARRGLRALREEAEDV